jgi:hypothetical protein
VAGRRLALDAALVAACVALALWTYRRVLAGYFTNDDFVYLERARGLLPQQSILLWRFLSGPAYFRAVRTWFGLNPFPYHLVNWLIHGLNVALLYAWVRRWGGGALAAFTAAGLFGASRHYLSTLQQAVTIGDVAALTLALAALLVATGPGRARLPAAVALFAAALLTKENVLLLPVVLLAPMEPGEPARPRIARAAALLVPSVALLLVLAAQRAQSTTFSGESYAMAFDSTLLRNLATYATWATDFGNPAPDLAGVTATSPWSAGAWLTPALVLIAVVTWRWSRLAAVGAAWWVLSLAPVLPFKYHLYAHYAYEPRAGLGMALGGFAGWLSARLPRSARAAATAWALAVVLVFAHAARSGALLERRYSVLRAGSELPLDSFVRRSELARRVVQGFGRQLHGPHARVVIFTPREGMQLFSARTGEIVQGDSLSPRYFLLPAVIDQGRALRLLYPALDSVAFVDRWTPGYRDFDLFVTGTDGAIKGLGRGLEAQVALASRLLAIRYDATAREQLGAAVPLWPDDPRLRFAYGVALARTGDPEAALQQFRELVLRAPSDTLAAVARQLLARARR